MRQTIHKVVTVAAALLMSCALPYSTRANLDNTYGPNVADGRANSDMPAAESVKFLTFPRELDAVQASIDLSMADSLKVFVLTRGNTEPQWPSVIAPKVVPPESAKSLKSAHQINPNASPPAPAAHLSLPRQLEANVDRINFDAPVLAPMSFFRFCMRYPEDCKVRGVQAGEEPMTLTKERKAELAKVNRDVNRAITPHENDNGVMEEEWLVAPRAGDCHDYAVTKRHELLARGWPSSSLLLAEVVVASGEHHLVLVVRTNEEDVVLDNLNWNLRPVAQIPYQWVRAQQAENPKFWSKISVARAARVAMNAR